MMVIASALNYLDRQLLAAFAPTLKAEFTLTNEQYGLILLSFSVVYALFAPVFGLLIDRIGLAWGMSLAVAAWSGAGIATGLVSSFGSLLTCRAALGGAEAAAVPGFGKANGTYLLPREFALGAAVNQIGLSIGGIVAPLVASRLPPHTAGAWRSSSAASSGLRGSRCGFSRPGDPPRPEPVRQTVQVADMLRDRRFWALVAANILYMTMYTLWTNWTTLVLRRGSRAYAGGGQQPVRLDSARFRHGGRTRGWGARFPPNPGGCRRLPRANADLLD